MLKCPPYHNGSVVRLFNASKWQRQYLFSIIICLYCKHQSHQATKITLLPVWNPFNLIFIKIRLKFKCFVVRWWLVMSWWIVVMTRMLWIEVKDSSQESIMWENSFTYEFYVFWYDLKWDVVFNAKMLLATDLCFFVYRWT